MPDPTTDPTNQGGGFSGALNSILSNPLVTTLLPVALGVVGGLGQPGTKWGGGTGKALEGAAAGLQQGQETRALQAQAQREQQELALKTQQLNQQKALNDITLSNEQIKQKYLQSLPPDKQAQFLADPKAYMDMDLMTKAAPASIAALKATGKFSPDALNAFSTLDPVTLHDVTAKSLEAFTAGKETDLNKVHDAILAADNRPIDQKQKDSEAWTAAAMQLKAAPQIAVTEAHTEGAKEVKETAPGENADVAAERAAHTRVETERAAGTLPAAPAARPNWKTYSDPSDKTTHTLDVNKAAPDPRWVPYKPPSDRPPDYKTFNTPDGTATIDVHATSPDPSWTPYKAPEALKPESADVAEKNLTTTIKAITPKGYHYKSVDPDGMVEFERDPSVAGSVAGAVGLGGPDTIKLPLPPSPVSSTAATPLGPAASPETSTRAEPERSKAPPPAQLNIRGVGEAKFVWMDKKGRPVYQGPKGPDDLHAWNRYEEAEPAK